MENISIASDIIHELTGWRLRDDFYLFDSTTTSFLVDDAVIHHRSPTNTAKDISSMDNADGDNAIMRWVVVSLASINSQ